MNEQMHMVVNWFARLRSCRVLLVGNCQSHLQRLESNDFTFSKRTLTSAHSQICACRSQRAIHQELGIGGLLWHARAYHPGSSVPASRRDHAAPAAIDCGMAGNTPASGGRLGRLNKDLGDTGVSPAIATYSRREVLAPSSSRSTSA